MKYNWPAVVDEFRKIVMENIAIDGKKPNEYFRVLMLETDSFHPWNSDGQLSKALSRLPTYCNYRSCEALRNYKISRNNINDAIDEMLCEVEDIIIEYMHNLWNHAPGYRRPKTIEFKWTNDGVTPRMVARIVRAAKRP